MEIKNLKCDNCGALIQTNAKFKCEYCGAENILLGFGNSKLVTAVPEIVNLVKANSIDSFGVELLIKIQKNLKDNMLFWDLTTNSFKVLSLYNWHPLYKAYFPIKMFSGDESGRVLNIDRTMKNETDISQLIDLVDKKYFVAINNVIKLNQFIKKHNILIIPNNLNPGEKYYYHLNAISYVKEGMVNEEDRSRGILWGQPIEEKETYNILGDWPILVSLDQINDKSIVFNTKENYKKVWELYYLDLIKNKKDVGILEKEISISKSVLTNRNLFFKRFEKYKDSLFFYDVLDYGYNYLNKTFKGTFFTYHLPQEIVEKHNLKEDLPIYLYPCNGFVINKNVYNKSFISSIKKIPKFKSYKQEDKYSFIQLMDELHSPYNSLKYSTSLYLGKYMFNISANVRRYYENDIIEINNMLKRTKTKEFDKNELNKLFEILDEVQSIHFDLIKEVEKFRVDHDKYETDLANTESLYI